MKSFQETHMNKGDEPEESTWTFYFEEFLWQNDDQDLEMIMSYDETVNYLVPDTASSGIVKKTVCIQDHDEAKTMRYKKRKTYTMMIDDSLEDTASSPLSSPKVTYFDQVKTKNKKTMPISEEKVDTCEEQNTRNYSNMELKKRGLCLVPLSSLANYIS